MLPGGTLAELTLHAECRRWRNAAEAVAGDGPVDLAGDLASNPP